ncbi:DNA translocase FtsK [Isoptericola sp. NPDC056578]|uniref:DNA translocase FtsK n=1 Tax=Isoptericola sp. NPDC056578 TaxID=3345870 RepID=UPI0036D0A0C1
MAASGVASVLGHAEMIGASVGLGFVGGTVVTTLGARGKRRRDLEDRTLEALAPTLGVRRLDRRTVIMSNWTQGWPGVPRKIRVYYAPGVLDAGVVLEPKVIGTLAVRLGAKYKVVRHHLKHCYLVLKLDRAPQAAEQEARPPALERALQALTSLIGPTVELVGYDMAREDELGSITISHQAGTKMAAGGYRTRIEGVVSTMMAGRWRAQWDLEHDLARFEQRPLLPGSIWLPDTLPDDMDDLLDKYDQVRIPKAIDEDGNELFWEPARVPQMLITGGTGSGKTSTTHSIVGKITQFGWPVWVADGKGVEFLHHRTWPNVQIVATTVEEQVAVVYRAYTIVKERYRLITQQGFRVEDFEPLVVVLDEWSETVQGLLGWYDDVKQRGEKNKPPTLSHYSSLARLARTARVHLIVTMQRPDVQLFGEGGGEARSNFGERISVGRLDPAGANMMWNSTFIGVTIPNGARQRAITTGADGRPVEAQCYRFPSMTAPDDSEDGKRRESLKPQHNRHPRLLIVPPEPRYAGEEELPLGFWDYAKADWVLAEDRPDLDPVVMAAQHERAGDARTAASALTLLGVGTSSPANAASLRKAVIADPTGDAATIVVNAIDHELLLEAAELVITAQFVSRPMLQRKLRIGYAHAGRVLDQLAEHDVIVLHDPDSAADDEQAPSGDGRVLAGPDDLASTLERLRPLAGAAAGTRARTDEDPGGDEWEPSELSTTTPGDAYAGFGEPQAIGPDNLVVGDLIQMEDAESEWVFVDEHPEPDILDAGCIAISWRGDGDEYGSVSLPADTTVMTRRPLEHS